MRPLNKGKVQTAGRLVTSPNSQWPDPPGSLQSVPYPRAPSGASIWLASLVCGSEQWLDCLIQLPSQHSLPS